MFDRYIFSGSLPEEATSYVTREADTQLYEGLKKGKFCYVLNSRQTGKSSLRVRTMRRLREEGFACVAIDLSFGGIQSVTSEQWYVDLLDTFIDSLALNVDLEEWWFEHKLLSPLKRFRKFIEEVLLVEVSKNIVIFIDEIDSVLSLNFPTDDFFAFLRASYNQRIDNPEYKRVTFCLLGVASPSELIADKKRTPFNIGHRIELAGFTLAEAQPLAIGLTGKVTEPKQVLAEILHWTGGQPFLTQKLCHLVVIHASNGKVNVKQLVTTQIIAHWEYQDEPEHLRTIRDRIIHRDEKLRGRILGLHQQLLEGKIIAIEASSEQIELRLSGLATSDKNQLRITNPIYKSIFNRDWVERELAKLHPYAESFNAWVASNEQDESRLLRGQALQEALAWSADKGLSDRDNRFISASLELDSREAKTALKAERQANKILTRAKKRAVWISGAAIAAFVLSVVTSVIIINRANYQAQQKITAAAAGRTSRPEATS